MIKWVLVNIFAFCVALEISFEHIYKHLNVLAIEFIFSKSRWGIKGYSTCLKKTDSVSLNPLERWREEKITHAQISQRVTSTVHFTFFFFSVIVQEPLIFFFLCLNDFLVICHISVLSITREDILFSKTKLRSRFIIIISAMSILYISPVSQ